MNLSSLTLTESVKARALELGFDLVAVGPAGRPFLQRPPAGQHDSDHRGCQQFAYRQRAGQREQCDDIHPGPTVAKSVGHGPQGVGGPAPADRGPDGIPGGTHSGRVQKQARGQA